MSIEVADYSLKYDREVKAIAYAKSYHVRLISYDSHSHCTPPLNPLPASGEGRRSIALAGWGSSVLISNQADMISGIADYWILDVNQRKLHVYRLPSPDGYQSETILSFICDNFTAGIWCYSYRSTGIIATCKLRAGDRSFHSTNSLPF